MKRVRELYEGLEAWLPRSLSCEWDNDGLQCCGDPDTPVHRVLVVLDITDAVIERAIREEAQLIVAHHPLLFRPLKAINPDNANASRVIRMLRAGISAMSFHTRLDAAEGGVNDCLAARLGLTETQAFGCEGEEALGRIGLLAEQTSLQAFARTVRETLGSPLVLLGDAGRTVQRVAVLGGEGKDEIGAAVAAGADTFVSGRLGYHNLLDAAAYGINLVEAGHFYTELPVVEALRDRLLKLDPTLDVRVAGLDSCEIGYVGGE
jgi:dinuclear metal center YbgI/SA1388 family protein